MRLITLNVWGGKLLDPLLQFIKEYSGKIDIFCFQEIYSSPEKRVIARNMNSQVLEEISAILKNYQVFYAPHLKNRDMKNLIKIYNISSTRSNTYEGVTRFADYILVSSAVAVTDFQVIDTSVSDQVPLYLDFK